MVVSLSSGLVLAHSVERTLFSATKLEVRIIPVKNGDPNYSGKNFGNQNWIGKKKLPLPKKLLPGIN